MIDTLQGGYTNAWLLRKDLQRLAQETEDPDLRRLYELLNEHFTYPVDSIVVGPDLEVRGQLAVTEVMQGGPVDYLRFLEDAAAGSGD